MPNQLYTTKALSFYSISRVRKKLMIFDQLLSLYLLYCLHYKFCIDIGENNTSFTGKADLRGKKTWEYILENTS
jgi:hypothetical protein